MFVTAKMMNQSSNELFFDELWSSDVDKVWMCLDKSLIILLWSVSTLVRETANIRLRLVPWQYIDFDAFLFPLSTSKQFV